MSTSSKLALIFFISKLLDLSIKRPSSYKNNSSSWIHAAWFAYTKHCRDYAIGIQIFYFQKIHSNFQKISVKKYKWLRCLTYTKMWQIQRSTSSKKINGTGVVVREIWRKFLFMTFSKNSHKCPVGKYFFWCNRITLHHLTK